MEGDIDDRTAAPQADASPSAAAGQESRRATPDRACKRKRKRGHGHDIADVTETKTASKEGKRDTEPTLSHKVHEKKVAAEKGNKMAHTAQESEDHKAKSSQQTDRIVDSASSTGEHKQKPDSKRDEKTHSAQRQAALDRISDARRDEARCALHSERIELQRANTGLQLLIVHFVASQSSLLIQICLKIHDNYVESDICLNQGLYLASTTLKLILILANKTTLSVRNQTAWTYQLSRKQREELSKHSFIFALGASVICRASMDSVVSRTLASCTVKRNAFSLNEAHPATLILLKGKVVLCRLRCHSWRQFESSIGL